MKPLLLALQFLTVITVKSDLEAEERDLARATAFYPLVGLLIGVILAAGTGIFQFLWPPLVSDILTVVLLLVLTRGLHLDGVADTMDGVLGGANRERCLEIMKDSNLGTFGVAGIVMTLLLKFLALASIPSYFKWQALLVMPVLSRYSMVQLAYRSSYARRERGLGSHLEGTVRPRELMAALVTAVLVAVAVLGGRGFFCLVLIAAFTLLYQAWFKRKLGGVTGDVFGCVNECNEVLFLLAFSALTAQGL